MIAALFVQKNGCYFGLDGVDPWDDAQSESLVSWCGNKTSKFDTRPRLGKKAASATPAEFRSVLLEMAASARP